jgi:hypothetical protein
VELTYFGKTFMPGALFDALRIDGLAMINRDEADPFNLEDPSQRSLDDMLDNLLPQVPPVTLSPTSDTVAMGGTSAGTFDVTITGPGQSRTWIVTKDASATWLTIVSPTTPQSVDGPVNYTVAPNAGGARSANMYVNGKTFTVNQDPFS